MRNDDDLTDIDLYDPDRYVAGPPHEEFARLRRHCPVFRQRTPDGGFYWAVTRHADVVTVSTDPGTFSSARAGTTGRRSAVTVLTTSRRTLSFIADAATHDQFFPTLFPFDPSF